MTDELERMLEAGGPRLRVAVEAAQAAGALLAKMQPGIAYREKAARDLVTEADLAAQNLILERLATAFPDDHLIGEESAGAGPPAGLRDPSVWVVDPLDGTTNYVHGIPFYCVSIGFLAGGNPRLGVIYHPQCDDLYVAVAGWGAFCNGKRLRVSSCTELEQALVAVSFAARVERDSQEVRDFLGIMGSAQAIRRVGSAALNLAYVAAGRFDGYWARNGKIWDVAAGILLVREAGGLVQGVDGRPFDAEAPHCAAASNEELLAQLRAAAG